MPRPAAPACKAARDTATVALPPRRCFVGVPSSSIILASIAAWSAISSPFRAGAMSLRIPIERGLNAIATQSCTAVTEVDRLALTARRTRRRDCTPDPSVLKFDFGFDRRAPARVPNPAPADPPDLRSRHCAWIASSICARTSPMMRGRSANRFRATRRTRLAIGFLQIFDRRFAVDARQHQRRQDVGHTRLHRLRRLPINEWHISRPEGGDRVPELRW